MLRIFHFETHKTTVPHSFCVLYFPDKVFCLKECGENALELLYRLEDGYVYSDYAIIPFELEQVRAISDKKSRIIEDYEELKEWWEDEK